MNENPYQSPTSFQTVKKRPKKRPNRYILLLVCGWLGLWAAILWRELIETCFSVSFSISVFHLDNTLSFFLLIACPIGLVMACWAWRHPQSKRPFAAAVALAVPPFILRLLIGLVFHQ